jgi:YggT family protein
MDGILAAGYFLFSLVFSLISFTLWLRFAMRYLNISALHPINQVILKLTNPLVLPITKLTAKKNTRRKRVDWPCFITLVIFEVIKFLLIGFVFFTSMLPLNLLIIYPMVDLIVQPLNLLFYAIFIRVIMSWINPAWRNPLGDLLIMVTEPVLGFVRKYIPPFSGLDFSPFIVLIIIKVITLFASASLPFHLV